MALAKFVIKLENGQEMHTKTLCAAIKTGCQSVGANHIKSKKELLTLAAYFWLWRAHLTIKVGVHMAIIQRIGEKQWLV